MADIKSTIVNLTNNLTKTSGDLVKNTKLSLELASQEENLKSLYVEIGKKVHEIYSFGGSLGQAFDDLYKDIVMCEAKINDLRERIDVVKGVRSCPNCGKGVDRKSEFCPSCGARMIAVSGTEKEMRPEVVPGTIPEGGESGIVESVPCMENREEIKSYKKCQICGAENEVGSRFCLSCGRII